MESINKGREKNFSVKLNLCIMSIVLMASITTFMTGCDLIESDDDPEPVVFEYDLSESEHDWEPFFTDYPVGWGDNMQLTAEYRTLPEPLDTTRNAYFISAVNRSDDVKMLFRRQVNGLEPNTTYSVQFSVEFATEVPSGCVGIGGAPGESVRVIASSSAIKPEPVIDEDDPHDDGYYLLNIQHLDDPAQWHNNAIMGDIANSRECEEGYQFELKEVSSGFDHDRVTTDDDGNAWLLFGTRSGFEGQTNLYYTRFSAEFRR